MQQCFDCEQEVYLERIQKLQKELATKKELCSSAFTTIVSAVPGSRKGDAPSQVTGGDELPSVSVKKPMGKHASVVNGSEHRSTCSVQTGVLPQPH